MNEKITLMLIPESGEKVFSKTFPVILFKILVFAIVLWMLVLLILSVFYSRLTVQAAKSNMLENENHRLRGYLARVVEMEKSFKKNKELAARVAELAGISLEDFSLSQSINFDSIGNIQENLLGDSALAEENISKSVIDIQELAKQKIPRGTPLYGWITKTFILDDSLKKEKHTGIDFAVKQGTSVRATASGVVLSAEWDKDFGNVVVLDHENGYHTIYGHNENLLVRQGQRVLKGDVIALSGNTGHSTAPHLHYEIRKNGKPIDPLPYID